MSGQRVIAIDLPGHGRSHPPSDLGADSLIDPIHDLLVYLKVDRCIMAGHSLGGLAAVHYAKTHPSSMLSLLMLDAHLFTTSDLLRRRLSPFHCPSVALPLAAQFTGGLIPMKGVLPSLFTSTAVARELFLWPYVFRPRLLDGTVLQHALAGNAGPIGVLTAYRIAKTYDVRVAASAVRCPVDLAWGAHDRLLQPSDHEDAEAHFDVRRRLEIAEAGHWPQLEKPDVVAEFLGNV